MTSVTGRIKMVKQPRGGYLNPRQFQVVELEPLGVLHEEENIHASLVGIAVDYLTRWNRVAGEWPNRWWNFRARRESALVAERAFEISLLGARLIGDEDHARKLIKSVRGLDRKSVVSACQLAGYDVVYRAGVSGYREVRDIAPDRRTVENVATMVRRSTAFLDEYGPVTLDGFTLEGGYTDWVTVADGDYVTADALWDFKVSKNPPKKEATLQILMYYLMGRRAGIPEFENLRRIGLYNPRLSRAYVLEAKDIPPRVIYEVERDVIGY
ncbi:hypothetical protein ACTQ49_06120 [Luteococcus sp. Sow4_B9]|uniref:hypothetical protein n=1 Tax=Luteococcus sp. Sow4_B9 TaxID=3438792 RepID=UPI003F9CF80E